MTMNGIFMRSAVIPVVAVRDVDEALNIAAALLAGGVTILEITLRTPACLPAIRAVRATYPEMVVGCGTIRTVAEVGAAQEAGAQFLVSPGTPSELAEAMADSGVAALPGASTVTEMLALKDLGFTHQKFFPAEASGGAKFLKAIHAILPEVVFCPTGGITSDNMGSYLDCPNVVSVGGSWLAPQNFIDDKNWEGITHIAKCLPHNR